MSVRALRVCMQAFSQAKKADNAKYYMCEDNRAMWYALIEPSVAPVDGKYIVRIDITQDYPMTLPHFYILTPNGVIAHNAKICLDGIVESTTSVHKMIDAIIAALIMGESLGTDLSTDREQQMQLAALSASFNNDNYPRECASLMCVV